MSSTLHQSLPAAPEPDANWPAIAADFVSLGCTAETFPLPPAMTAGEYARFTSLMAQHQAAGVTAILEASR